MKPLFTHSFACTQCLISWLSLCLSQGSTKVNYLQWQLKWLWPKKKRGGIILLPCDFYSPLRSWKWQDAVCFCLLINISVHYTWNAPVTLNTGPVRTPLLSSLVIWHQVMRSESWKTSASRPPPSLPNEICERIAGSHWSLYKIKRKETQTKYRMCKEDWYGR